jgi:hypothetical protein
VDELVERARAGDRDAFASLVSLTSDRMYAIAIRILPDGHLAEDALQGAPVTVWRQLPTLRDTACFEARARRLLIHACYAEARRRQTWTANVRVLPVGGPAGPDEIVSVADRDTLDRASDACPSSSGRSSCSITTRVSPSPRSPTRSASRPGRPDHACITRPGRCARPSRQTRRPSSLKDGWHDHGSRLRPRRSSLARPDARRSAGPNGGRRPPGRRDDAAGAAPDPMADVEVLNHEPSTNRARRGGCRRRRGHSPLVLCRDVADGRRIGLAACSHRPDGVRRIAIAFDARGRRAHSERAPRPLDGRPPRHRHAERRHDDHLRHGQPRRQPVQ